MLHVPAGTPTAIRRAECEYGPFEQQALRRMWQRDDWVLLATWRCGEEVRELDLGVVSWLIRRGELAAGRCDRVYGYVDM